jgi:hypothetical protein
MAQPAVMLSLVCAHELHPPAYPRYLFIALEVHSLTARNQKKYDSSPKIHDEVIECPGIF